MSLREGLNRFFGSINKKRQDNIQARLDIQKQLDDYHRKEQILLERLDTFFEKQEANVDGGQTAITALYLFTEILDRQDKIEMHAEFIDMQDEQQTYLQYAQTDLEVLQNFQTHLAIRSPNLYVPCHQFIEKIYLSLNKVYEEIGHDPKLALNLTRITLTHYRDNKYPLRNSMLLP